MTFEETKEEFHKETSSDEGHNVMAKITEIVNDIGSNFIAMNGGELAEAQVKLAGYKFYLADYVGKINRTYESLRLGIKQRRANKWDEITETIKAKEGKVKNKEQIENVLTKMNGDDRHMQMLYETLYYKYRLKISSVDSILTALTQRIALLKRELEQTK